MQGTRQSKEEEPVRGTSKETPEPDRTDSDKRRGIGQRASSRKGPLVALRDCPLTT